MLHAPSGRGRPPTSKVPDDHQPRQVGTTLYFFDVLTWNPILGYQVLGASREPFARSLARIKVIIRVLFHSVCDQRTILHERPKHL
jgi:hypothetical protein